MHNINQEAEQAILGILLLYPANLDKVDLDVRDFYYTQHRHIYLALRKLAEAHETVDSISVSMELRRIGQLEQTGGEDYIDSLCNACTGPELLPSYCASIRELAEARRIAEGAQRVLAIAASDVLDTPRLLEAAKSLSAYAEASPYARNGNAKILSAAALASAYPDLHPPVVDGLLRQSETMNLIAPPKVGKSWLAHSLALSIASGRTWLGLPTDPGPVLIIDNELHPSVLAYRLQRVADAMFLPDEWPESVHTLTLRGHLQPLDALISSTHRLIAQGHYRLIVLDALYRFVPSDRSENDNAMMAGIYNSIDNLAEQTGAAVVAIHHASRGDQSNKVVTDVGAGAGAQSRAADAHIVLRAHEEEGVYVLDGAVRSFPPLDPLCIRWDFPLWSTVEGLDPTLLRSAKPQRRPAPLEERPAKPKPADWPPERFAETFLTPRPQTKDEILSIASQSGLSVNLAQLCLRLAETKRLAFRWTFGGNRSPRFSSVPQDGLVVMNMLAGEGPDGGEKKADVRVTEGSSLGFKKGVKKPSPLRGEYNSPPRGSASPSGTPEGVPKENKISTPPFLQSASNRDVLDRSETDSESDDGDCEEVTI